MRRNKIKKTLPIKVSESKKKEIISLLLRTELEPDEEVIDNTSKYISQKTGVRIPMVNFITDIYLHDKWESLNHEINTGKRLRNTLDV